MKNKYRFTFICLFLFGCSQNNNIVTVVIQPYATIPKPVIDSVAVCLKNTYGVKVFFLPYRPLPMSASINVKNHRYRADKIIELLQEEKHDSIDYILALTDKDISFTKKDEQGNIKKPESKYSDWGIFGLGYQPGVSCIVSTYRLNNSSGKKFIERVKKVSIHELGHNLGLPHCRSESCVMKDAAESIQTIDLVTIDLCDKCKQKILK